ncbi:hypothetical protein PT974_06101 [Cladobotryum mycophilum]|uniref:Clr5 domain-containing protein n=1 Tax=Cladobotryum mycophilum TaxID=491253 RepID=A0ABR0SLI3_9HYPO
MVYDWDSHHGVCYQLYIEEGKSLEEIMDHLKDVYKFTPSKRAFQTQFRRWNFPSKQKPAHRDDRLVSRIKELWERNLAQREMLRVLNEEDGFNIKHRELMRVRTMNRWLLRIPNGDKSESFDLDDEDESLEDGPSSALLDQHQIISLQHNDHEVSLQPVQHSISLHSPDVHPEMQDFEEPFDKYDRRKKGNASYR